MIEKLSLYEYGVDLVTNQRILYILKNVKLCIIVDHNIYYISFFHYRKIKPVVLLKEKSQNIVEYPVEIDHLNIQCFPVKHKKIGGQRPYNYK